MKQKVNKKLVKRFKSGEIAAYNSGNKELLKILLSKTINCKLNKLSHVGAVKFYLIEQNGLDFTGMNVYPKTEVIPVEAFFKPAKVKLKDVDKPIWFPNIGTQMTYKIQLEKYNLYSYLSPDIKKDSISYKDIKWPKTKSSLEDRVTALEKEKAIFNNKTEHFLEFKVLEIMNHLPKDIYVDKTLQSALKDMAVHLKQKIVTPSGEVREPANLIPDALDIEKKRLKVLDEIESEPKEEPIDWSKPQFFTSNKGLVVLSTGNHTEDMDDLNFEAVIIRPNMFHKNIGELSKIWNKACFKPFKGTITV